MNIVDHVFDNLNSKHVTTLYPLGDLHVGALNCAEKALKVLVKEIADDPNAVWLGGGDLIDAVTLKDNKRFDVGNLPEWLINDKSGSARFMLGDLIKAQKDRFLDIVDPIKDKCLGLIEGNHEFDIYKHYGRDLQNELVTELDTVNLTDMAFIRLIFRTNYRSVNKSLDRKSSKARENNEGSRGRVITVLACHGMGGGRTAGAEANKLARLAADKDCDILLTGHSHSFCIPAPVPMMYVSRSTKCTPISFLTREKYVANWGSMMYTYAKGPSTYASRANYPVRPMYTVRAVIEPFKQKHISNNCGETDTCQGNIRLEQVKLHDRSE